MVMNHNGNTVTLDLQGKYTELISGGIVNGTLTLQSYGVAVLA